MPCQSYEDPRDSANEREIRDKLARIACKALTHIEDANDGGLEKLILQDPEIAEWWREHKEADRKAQAIEELKRRKAEEARRIQEERNRIKAKLSAEELRILGIK